MKAFLLCAAILMTGCPNPQPVPPTPDADAALIGDAPPPDASDVYGAACLNLKVLTCREGLAATCPLDLQKVVGQGLQKLDPVCVRDAKDIATVQRCGIACKQ